MGDYLKNILDRDLHVILLIVGSLMMIYSAFYCSVILGIFGCVLVGIYLIICILYRSYKYDQMLKNLTYKEGDKNVEDNIL